MPRKLTKAQKEAEALPPKELHGYPREAVGFAIEELPHLTFYGRNWTDVAGKVRAELRRQYGDRYTLTVVRELQDVFDNLS